MAVRIDEDADPDGTGFWRNPVRCDFSRNRMDWRIDPLGGWR